MRIVYIVLSLRREHCACMSEEVVYAYTRKWSDIISVIAISSHRISRRLDGLKSIRIRTWLCSSHPTLLSQRANVGELEQNIQTGFVTLDTDVGGGGGGESRRLKCFQTCRSWTGTHYAIDGIIVIRQYILLTFYLGQHRQPIESHWIHRIGSTAPALDFVRYII